jgi:hypothetical protein
MSMCTRAMLVLLGATGALAMSQAAAPLASAKSSVCNPGCEAKVGFRAKSGGNAKKETLVIRDREADGHSAVGYIQIFDRRLDEWLGLGRAIYFNSRGAHERPRQVKIQVGNGRAIRYQACVGERGENVFFDCGPFRRDRA